MPEMLPEYTRRSGFTLIELMVTLGIAAIVMALAIPNLTTMIKDNRITTQVNQLITAFNFMRSEAVKQGMRVTMCKSSDGATCVADGDASDWSQGWIMFTDQNQDATYNDPGDTLLKVQVGAESQITAIGNSSVADYVSYVSSGATLKTNGAFQTGSITVCDDRDGETGKKIVFNNTGRARTQEVTCN